MHLYKAKKKKIHAKLPVFLPMGNIEVKEMFVEVIGNVYIHFLI